MSSGVTSPGDERSTSTLRWSIYGLLIAIALGQMVGRIISVTTVADSRLSRQRVKSQLEEYRQRQIEKGLDEQVVAERVENKRAEVEYALGLERPFLSANDRSRWLTIRSLVEEGRYEVDSFFREPRWDSIDMVSHPGRDGEQHYYSSKPPLLATLLAGKYWVIKQITGWTLGSHPYEVVRTMLLLVNIPAMLVLFFIIAKLAEQLGTTDWGRVFVVACATQGTLLTTFAITLNNHTIAAASAAVAIYFFVQIARRDTTESGPHSWHFAACGLAAAFTAANELPALSFMALLGLLLVIRDLKRTLLWGVPPVVLVAAGFFGTNYLAHESLRPPYMHRSETNPADNWYFYSYEKNGRTVQSYWQDRKGIDVGEPSKLNYAFQVILGHHGVYSLTPVWLLSLVGMAMWLTKGQRLNRELAFTALALTLVCFVFFIALRPQGDRNYGGMTMGFRWMFWLAPLWLTTLMPAIDRLQSRGARIFALALLALSAISVNYAAWNPWRHPWLYHAMEYFGWL